MASSTTTAPAKVPRVFFGNLPHYQGDEAANTAHSGIVELCRPFGAISDVVVHPGKGTAFVTFPSMSAAEYAIFKLDRSSYSGDILTVNWAKTKEEREAQRNRGQRPYQGSGGQSPAQVQKGQGQKGQGQNQGKGQAQSPKGQTKAGQAQSPKSQQQGAGKSGQGQNQGKEAEAKNEPKAEVKGEAKVEPKTEGKSEAKAKPEGKNEAKVQNVPVTEPKKVEVPVEKPRLAQFQQPTKTATKKDEVVSKQKVYVPVGPKASPTVAPARYLLHIENETTHAKVENLSISHEEYVKYILPLLTKTTK